MITQNRQNKLPLLLLLVVVVLLLLLLLMLLCWGDMDFVRDIAKPRKSGLRESETKCSQMTNSGLPEH